MRHVITLICDDVRQELGNKLSIMGIYDDTIIPSELPARLQKLAFFQRWEDVEDAQTVRIEFSGTALAGSHIINGEIVAEPPGSAPKTKLQILVGLGPFLIEREGQINVSTYFNDANRAAYMRTLHVKAKE